MSRIAIVRKGWVSKVASARKNALFRVSENRNEWSIFFIYGNFQAKRLLMYVFSEYLEGEREP